LRLVEAAETFSVAVWAASDRIIVVPSGDLDVATVGVLARHLDLIASHGFDAIVIDLRGLGFIDSTGLRLLIDQTSRPDATVTLIDGNADVSRLFDITGTRGSLTFEEPAGR
jgi:anti-anti-sigma factor